MKARNSFAHSLGTQLRILLNRSCFQFAWLVMLVISLSAFFNQFRFNFNSIVSWLHSVDDNFLFGNHPAARDMFLFFLPVACAVAFADSTIEEKNSGLLPAVLMRQTKTQYYFSKMLACMVAAVLVVAVPLLINFALNAIIYPTPFESEIWPDGRVAGQRAFYEIGNDLWMNMPLKSLYIQNIYLYILAYIGMAGLYAGVGAAFSYAMSYFFKYRVLVLLPFFLLQQILSLFSSFTRERWDFTLDISSFLRTAYGASFVHHSVFFIILACMVLITAFLVPFGLRKLRNVY